MRQYLRFVAMALVCLACSSCVTMAIISSIESNKQAKRVKGAEFGYYEADMYLKTIQRVSENAALAMTGSGDVVCVVSYFGEYYDGKILSGKFVRNGTYSYVTVEGANKEVLIYVSKPYYNQLKDYWVK